MGPARWTLGESVEREADDDDAPDVALTAQELDAYLATGEPLEVAGAFTLDGLGAPFVRRVEGDPACHPVAQDRGHRAD